MWTSTVLVTDALPAQPLIVIVDATVVLSGIGTSVGLVPVHGGGTFTVNSNIAVCVALAPEPVTVIGYVPVGVVGVVAIMRVDEPPELIDDGLNVAVAPAGRPDAFRFTVCAEPSVTAVGTVEVTELPGVTDAVDGVSVIEKSFRVVGAGGFGAVVGAGGFGAVVGALVVGAGGFGCVGGGSRCGSVGAATVPVGVGVRLESADGEFVGTHDGGFVATESAGTVLLRSATSAAFKRIPITKMIKTARLAVSQRHHRNVAGLTGICRLP
jgi:hypothetical protein